MANKRNYQKNYTKPLCANCFKCFQMYILGQNVSKNMLDKKAFLNSY